MCGKFPFNIYKVHASTTENIASPNSTRHMACRRRVVVMQRATHAKRLTSSLSSDLVRIVSNWIQYRKTSLVFARRLFVSPCIFVVVVNVDQCASSSSANVTSLCTNIILTLLISIFLQMSPQITSSITSSNTSSNYLFKYLLQIPPLNPSSKVINWGACHVTSQSRSDRRTDNISWKRVGDQLWSNWSLEYSTVSVGSSIVVEC